MTDLIMLPWGGLWKLLEPWTGKAVSALSLMSCSAVLESIDRRDMMEVWLLKFQVRAKTLSGPII